RHGWRRLTPRRSQGTERLDETAGRRRTERPDEPNRASGPSGTEPPNGAVRTLHAVPCETEQSRRPSANLSPVVHAGLIGGASRRRARWGPPGPGEDFWRTLCRRTSTPA